MRKVESEWVEWAPAFQTHSRTAAAWSQNRNNKHGFFAAGYCAVFREFIAAKEKTKMVKEILLLGDPRLYEISQEIAQEELPQLSSVTQDLHDTMMAFRERYHVGRAIAAPQIGVAKRLIYLQVDEPVTLLNPVLTFADEEQMTVLDDCMSFPGLLVKVRRYRRCRVEFRDLAWERKSLELSGDLSELIQHEYDHLDGILATMRAIDNRSFFLKQ